MERVILQEYAARIVTLFWWRWAGSAAFDFGCRTF